MQLNVRKRKEYDPITEPENLDSESESDTVEITNLTRSFSLIKPKRISRKNESYYITDTFSRRDCSKFVADSPDSQKRCKCGQLHEEHSGKAVQRSHSFTASWDAQSDTVSCPTNAYGEINFMCAENDILPLYLRCDLKTTVADLGTLLLDKWCLPDPNLLISVFGGHSKFDAQVMAAESEIKEGLITAAQSTKAWLFTSGVNFGVSNMVGDAVAKKRSFVDPVPLIGVNCWGAVANNHELVHKEGLFPAHYHSLAAGDVERDASGKPKCMALEHEHTHFILLDGGTKFSFHENEVRKFRIALQQEVVRRTNAQLVSVLVEGGTGSLNEAKMRVGSGLPLVILGGSGRVSDVLCAAHAMAKVTNVVDGGGVREIRQIKDEEDRQKVRNSLVAALPGLTETEYDTLLESVEEVIYHEHLVTIWRSEKDEELDKSILKGLIKSLNNATNQSENDNDSTIGGDTVAQKEKELLGKELLKQQLDLAIQWDRLDIAEEFIFSNMILKQEEELNDILGLAIKHKKVSFIRNIIRERNANIKSFLTLDVFEEMLRNTPKNLLLHTLMSRQCPEPNEWTYEHFTQVVHKISEGVFQAPGKVDHGLKRSPSVDPVKRDYIEVRVSASNGEQPLLVDTSDIKIDSGNITKITSSHYDFEDPENLLVIYLVMTHEQELAKVFWEYSPTPLFLGMVCKYIHEWMLSKQKTSLYINDALAAKLTDFAKEFEGLSHAIIEEVAEYPDEFVLGLMNQPSTKWSNLSALEMADYSDSKSIIAHISVQHHINKEWMGWLDSDISTLRIIASLLCPLLASFRDVTSKDKQKWKDLSSMMDPDNVGLSINKSRKLAFIDRKKQIEEKKDINEKLPILTKCKYFYKAPITKFYIYMTVYMAFLFSFISALLINDKLDPNTCYERFTFRILFGCNLTLSEQLVYLWVFFSIPLEIRQIYFSYPTTVIGKLKIYISNIYNKNDVAAMSIILLALFFKILAGRIRDSVVDSPEYLAWAGNSFRLLFSIAFVLYTMRICQALQIDEKLGPKVMMMHQMLLDLTFFIWLVAIFLIGYGVSTTSIMNPNKEPTFSTTLTFDLFWRPYVNLFGEFNDDSIVEYMNENYCVFEYGANSDKCDGDYTCADDHDGSHSSVCVLNQYVVRIFLAVYMMLAAVLMLNLLVAVFSSTYESIQEGSAELWKRQKFDLMMEFKSRSILPVPLNTFLHCFRFIKFVIRKTCGERLGCCSVDDSDSVVRLDEHDRVKISLLESECRRNYLDKLEKQTDNEILQTDVKKLINNVEDVDKRLMDFETSIQRVLDFQSLNTIPKRSSRKHIRDVDYSPPPPKQMMEEQIEDGNMEVEEIDLDDILENLSVSVGEAHQEMSAMPQSDSQTGLITPDNRKCSRPTSNANAQPVDDVRLCTMGKKSRKLQYPGNAGIRRVYLNKEHWYWDSFVLNYSPLRYDDSTADKKLTDIVWNELVEEDERRSYEGLYLVRNQTPLNPCGRTGLSGRGKLSKYGPNHLAFPIITRFAKGERAATLSGENVLEVVMKCGDGEMLSLPEVNTRRNSPLPKEIQDYFCAENISGEVDSSKVMKRISKLFNSGILMYRGFIDSEYNTDNSWLEGIFVSYHDSDDNAFCNLNFPDSSPYRWRKVTKWNQVELMHQEYLQKVFYARSGYDAIVKNNEEDSEDFDED